MGDIKDVVKIGAAVRPGVALPRVLPEGQLVDRPKRRLEVTDPSTVPAHVKAVASAPAELEADVLAPSPVGNLKALAAAKPKRATRGDK